MGPKFYEIDADDAPQDGDWRVVETPGRNDQNRLPFRVEWYGAHVATVGYDAQYGPKAVTGWHLAKIFGDAALFATLAEAIEAINGPRVVSYFRPAKIES